MEYRNSLTELTAAQKFFAGCGGSTLSTLEKTEPDDIQRRVTMGIVVVVIAAVSAILASVAWAIPMGAAGYFVGIPWFLIMLLLERSILQQMDVNSSEQLAKAWMQGNYDEKAKGKLAGIGWLAIRFLMILFICYFNSEMVRVVMFKPEIVAEIKIRQNKETLRISDSMQVVKNTASQQLEKAGDDLAEAQSNMNALTADYDERIRATSDSLVFLTNKLPHEVRGPAGISGIAGDGPVAKSIRESIAALEQQKANLIADRDNSKTSSAQATALAFAKAQLDTTRSRTDAEFARLEKVQSNLVEEVMSRPVDGLAFMLSVLNDIASRNKIIWAVFFMFFFIEAIPVLLKFFSKDDSFIWQRAIDRLRMKKDKSEEASEIVEALERLRQKKAHR